MLIVATPYQAGPIEPIALNGEYIGVWTQGDWQFFRILHTETIPPSRQMVQNIGAVADSATSGATEITVARAQDGNLLHVRMRPLDPVEVTVMQQRATSRHTAFSATSRVNVQMGNSDPHWSAATYFVIGKEKSIWVDVANETGYALGQARLKFWGFRYIIDPLPVAWARVLRKQAKGQDLTPDEAQLGNRLKATLVPAEGREA